MTDLEISNRLDALAARFIELRRGHRAGVIARDAQVAGGRDRAMDRVLGEALALLARRRRRARGFWRGLLHRPARRLLLKDWRAVLARHEHHV